MNSPHRILTIANRHPRLRVHRKAVAAAIDRLDAEFAIAPGRRSGSRLRGCPPGELSLVFMTDAALARLHAQFLDDASITDVITFMGDAALGVAGELCVSADAAARQVASTPPRQRARGGADAFSRELMLYVVHGWLHLAGYDDLQPAKKRVMRRAEARAMRLLDRAGLQPQFALRPVGPSLAQSVNPRHRRLQVGTHLRADRDRSAALTASQQRLGLLGSASVST